MISTTIIPAIVTSMDCSSRPDFESICVAAETIANTAKDAGATLVGEILKIDDTNEADQTDGKIAAWVETIKA